MPLDPQTQALLTANLTNLESAIASGVERASYDGKSTDFRSLAEMRSIARDLRRQLGIAVPSRRTVAGFRSGF